MAKEDEIEKNPYKLSTEERTAPKDKVEKWFRDIADLQREGMEHGFQPQLLFGLPELLKEKWLTRVWNPYVRTLPEQEQRVIRLTTGPRKGRHTQKHTYRSK